MVVVVGVLLEKGEIDIKLKFLSKKRFSVQNFLYGVVR